MDNITMCILIILSFGGIFLGVFLDYLEKPKVYEIRTCQDLQDMNKDLDGTYILMDDLNCGEYLNDE